MRPAEIAHALDRVGRAVLHITCIARVAVQTVLVFHRVGTLRPVGGVGDIGGDGDRVAGILNVFGGCGIRRPAVEVVSLVAPSQLIRRADHRGLAIRHAVGMRRIVQKGIHILDLKDRRGVIDIDGKAPVLLHDAVAARLMNLLSAQRRKRRPHPSHFL